MDRTRQIGQVRDIERIKGKAGKQVEMEKKRAREMVMTMMMMIVITRILVVMTIIHFNKHI